jgi:hypothetical protein
VAAVELEDPARDVVEEIAVVGDGHDGALVVGQVALEPCDRLGVEVVGRLVEQQQVGLGEQQPRERDPATLAAGQRVDRRVARRATQRIHRLVEHLVELPSAGRVDLVLQARELVRGLLRVARGQLVEAIEQLAQVADAILDVAAHVLGGIEVRLLLEQPHGCAGRELRLAPILGVLPGHDPQERRLAGPVEAEDADLRAGIETQRDVPQDGLVRRVHAAELVHREYVLARHRSVRG